MGIIPPGRGRKAGLLVLGAFSLFGLFWQYVFLPLIISPSFASLSPLIAYPIYNIGWVLIVDGGLGGLLHLAAHRAFNLVRAILAGFSGWLFVSFIFDSWQGPFFLSPSGQILIPLGGQAGANTSVDAFTATIWATVFPSVVGTPAWYTLTYTGTTIIALALMVLLIFPGIIFKRRSVVRMT